MARRRMFSLDIIDTDDFLELPNSTQNLYFHFGMRADDDGFVASPNRIIRLTGCRNEDLNLLIEKGYIIKFDDGVCVIVHWKENNKIRADRYKETRYINHKNTLYESKTGYYFVMESNADTNGIPSGTQTVDSSDTNGEHRLGKVSIVKDSIDKDSVGENSIKHTEQSRSAAETQNNTHEEIQSNYSENPKHRYGEYNNVLLSDTDIESLKQSFPDSWLEKIERLSAGIELKGYKYNNHYLAITKWAEEDKRRAAREELYVPKSGFNNYNDTNKTDYAALEEKLLKIQLEDYGY